MNATETTTRPGRGEYKNSRRKILRVCLGASRSTQEYLVKKLQKHLERQKVDRSKALRRLTELAEAEAKRLGFKLARVCLKRK